MEIYKKVYTRENTLFCIQAWEEHQGHRLARYFGENVPLSIFDVKNGVAAVYYHETIWDIWQTIISRVGKTDPKIIDNLMDLYAKQIDDLEIIWKRGVLNSREELIKFFDFMADTWIGLSVSYCLPETENISKAYQDLGMALRVRSADFLDNTDRVILATLKKLYPELGELVKFLSIEEIKSGDLPKAETLSKRKSHFIYFSFKINTDTNDVRELAGKNGIEIIDERVPEGLMEVKGQVAMRGTVTGRVRVLFSKAAIGEMQDGEILVTAMTTPDYLPAMKKAVAFVTDEGGITCHAAIVARELGKPCIIGTKISTAWLKNGDRVEVNGTDGIVRKI